MSKKAVMPLTDYENACEIIREKTGIDALIKSGELTDKINKVFEQGKKTEYDRFWDTLQENGNRTSYECAFSGGTFSWNDKTYNPKYPIVCGSDTTVTANKTFYNIPLTDTKVPITIEGTRFDNTFAYCVYLKRIPSLTLNNLVRIQNPFQNCRALEELNVYGTIDIDGLNLSYSPLLTKASLLTVINALKDFSETVTINKEIVNNNDGTDIISDIYTIEEGKEYTWSYYCAEATGWFGNAETLLPEETLITSVAEEININGNTYIGFKTETKYWVEDRIATVYVYQDGSEIKVLRDWSNDNDIFDIINLTVTTPVTEKCTVTLGEANLNKLTEEEKATAINKGWKLQ